MELTNIFPTFLLSLKLLYVGTKTNYIKIEYTFEH